MRTSSPLELKTAADIASSNQDVKELFYFDMAAAGIWIARRGFVALNIMIGDAEVKLFLDGLGDVLEDASKGSGLMWDFGRTLIKQAVRS